jgi:hypothetical protein
MGIGLGIRLEVNVMVRGIGCDRSELVCVTWKYNQIITRYNCRGPRTTVAGVVSKARTTEQKFQFYTCNNIHRNIVMRI